MNNPTISICIPVYNGEEYLRQCLDSVLSQDYKHVEIIIVDDCSKDSTSKIVAEYVKTNPHIKSFINEKNLGLVGNWNRCLDLAKNEWITFMFQDDYYEKNAIQEYVNFINSNKIVSPLIVSQRHFLIESVSEVEDNYYKHELPRLDSLEVIEENSFISPGTISNAAVKHMSMNFIGEPILLMFKKGDERFNSDLEQICDLEFALRLASANGLHYLRKQLTRFRIHDDSITSQNITGKYYRMANLEPVKFAHLLLFSKVYENLRKQLSKRYRLRLRTYFYIRGHEAFVNAHKDESYLVDFNSAAKKFPHMNELRSTNLLRRLLLLILRLKRSVK